MKIPQNMNTFAVLGLGRFGKNLAMTLAAEGKDVLVIDQNRDKVNELADIVTYAVQADIGQEGALEDVGLSNVDCVIISLTENFEAELLALAYCRDLKVPYILAKARTERHARILFRVGADQIVLPEKEAGLRLAHRLCGGTIFDRLHDSDEYDVAELVVPGAWVGKNLADSKIRGDYHLSVIAVQKKEEMIFNPDFSYQMERGDRLYLLGRQENLLEVEKIADKES